MTPGQTAFMLTEFKPRMGGPMPSVVPVILVVETEDGSWAVKDKPTGRMLPEPVAASKLYATVERARAAAKGA